MDGWRGVWVIAWSYGVVYEVMCARGEEEQRRLDVPVPSLFICRAPRLLRLKNTGLCRPPAEEYMPGHTHFLCHRHQNKLRMHN